MAFTVGEKRREEEEENQNHLQSILKYLHDFIDCESILGFRLICACLWQVLIAVFISILRCVISMVVHSTVDAHTADRVSDAYESHATVY